MEERTDVYAADVVEEVIELLIRLSCFVVGILRTDQMVQTSTTFSK